MTNRINDQSQPMFYLDYSSLDDIPYILDYLKKRSGHFAIYFNGITVSFKDEGDRHAFVNGLKTIYNIMK